ncbi:unnamed protein product [Cylicocyclus nassatus]|uniref:UNC93-like protein MFSD11 n=1 Tax=Cylicocyclus nassatus TaxID=53992 RepID=A0AA36HHP7_CYLNA|nr:unnamed protein product [Cylicocyclus nassatus]
MVSHSLLNIVQLGLGFFLNFFAFNSQGFIEEPVIESAAKRQNINVHAGYYSLSIIYATFTLGNFVAAPIIDILSPKWGMCLAALCYAAFQAGFLQISEVYLYISSAILGFGAAILWTGQGTYLAQNSNEKTSGRNSGLLWALSEGSLLGGGVFLFIVFHSSETTDNISTSTVRILYGVFTALACLSSLTFALLRPVRVAKVREGKPQYGRLLGSTFRLMFTKRMFLLAIVFAYTGIEQAFWTGY